MLHSQHLSNKPGEVIFGFLLVAFSLFLFWQSYSIAQFSALSSPGAFPMAASGLMVITSCIIAVQNLKLPKQEGARFTVDIMPKVVAVTLAMLLIFSVVLETVGFIITAFLFLFATLRYLHKSSWQRSFLLAFMVLVIIYVIFRLIFQVVLPEGFVPEREIMAWIEDLFKAKEAQ
ncbi:Tripartite tricarboxylate transporter TctB family protein [Marinobacterium sp. xm-g-59]|uniref:tripartite tricarboxylate transporter TctB family protein n=1 Tax=Marinobacterium sp. xm-g-59 TaxID=2497748 RepID=UPI001568914D|nr:tripartite tricarboxylate transporter TctB family protein [Marinobacterium sp. xm-g-59]NRP95936.1 Tripartite tricarboxylate transporter TctB family protein [Marinobacterium sp. xm-g-59]